MNKIGKMTKEEFIEAIKEILKPEPKPVIEEIKDKRTPFEHIKDFFNEPLDKEVFIRRGKFVKEMISTIIFVIVALILIRFFVFEVRWIPSASMKPTFIEGDRVFVERFSRFYSTPQRGDIMVFYPPEVELKNTFGKLFRRLTGFFCDDTAYIKRVIGLPGDKFEIKTQDNGASTVYINDIPLYEPYIKNPLDYPICSPEMMCGPMEIPENYYFMMGDNRGNSRDSRYWGLLHKDRFIGKATFVVRFARTNR